MIEHVKNKERKLSFSSINALLHSPKAFYDYINGEKVTTEAMEMGKLFHCLTLEPDTFKDRYVVFEKPIPSATMTKTENKEAYAALIESNPDKSVIKQEDKEKAQEMADMVLENKVSGSMVKEKRRAEVHVAFEYGGWGFTGFVDLDTYYEGRPVTVDLKQVPDAMPRKVKYTSLYRNLATQGFLYNYAITGDAADALWRPYFIIACDKKYVSVHRLDMDTITRGKLELDRAIQGLENLLFLYDQDGEDVFKAGLEFWAENKKYYII